MSLPRARFNGFAMNDKSGLSLTRAFKPEPSAADDEALNHKTLSTTEPESCHFYFWNQHR